MTNSLVVIALACCLVVLAAAMVGAAAGYLARRDNATYPAAVARACVAFAGTLTLAAALTTALAALVRQ